MATLNLSKLSNKEKAKLISKIHESMEPPEMSDAVKSILDERLERIQNGTAKYFTLDELKDRIGQLK